VGRVVAVAAAAIAGILSLPALLGSEAPPPVPADVGLAPSPASVEATADPAPRNPAPKADPGPSGELFRHTRKKSARRATADTKPRHPAHGRPKRRGSTIQTSSPPSLPVPAPVYIPPAAAEHFGFER